MKKGLFVLLLALVVLYVHSMSGRLGGSSEGGHRVHEPKASNGDIQNQVGETVGESGSTRVEIAVEGGTAEEVKRSVGSIRIVSESGEPVPGASVICWSALDSALAFGKANSEGLFQVEFGASQIERAFAFDSKSGASSTGLVDHGDEIVLALVGNRIRSKVSVRDSAGARVLDGEVHVQPHFSWLRVPSEARAAFTFSLESNGDGEFDLPIGFSGLPVSLTFELDGRVLCESYVTAKRGAWIELVVPMPEEAQIQFTDVLGAAVSNSEVAFHGIGREQVLTTDSDGVAGPVPVLGMIGSALSKVPALSIEYAGGRIAYWWPRNTRVERRGTPMPYVVPEWSIVKVALGEVFLPGKYEVTSFPAAEQEAGIDLFSRVSVWEGPDLCWKTIEPGKEVVLDSGVRGVDSVVLLRDSLGNVIDSAPIARMPSQTVEFNPSSFGRLRLVSSSGEAIAVNILGSMSGGFSGGPIQLDVPGDGISLMLPAGVAMFRRAGLVGAPIHFASVRKNGELTEFRLPELQVIDARVEGEISGPISYPRVTVSSAGDRNGVVEVMGNSRGAFRAAVESGSSLKATIRWSPPGAFVRRGGGWAFLAEVALPHVGASSLRFVLREGFLELEGLQNMSSTDTLELRLDGASESRYLVIDEILRSEEQRVVLPVGTYQVWIRPTSGRKVHCGSVNIVSSNVTKFAFDL